MIVRLQGRAIEAGRAQGWEGHCGHAGCLTQVGGQQDGPALRTPWWGKALLSPAQASPGCFNI